MAPSLQSKSGRTINALLAQMAEINMGEGVNPKMSGMAKSQAESGWLGQQEGNVLAKKTSQNG